MTQTKEQRSRIEVLRDAHPWLTDPQARGLLICRYKDITRDPSFRGPESLEVQMLSYTDILCRYSEYDVRNELAKAAEHFPCSWEELAENITEALEDDD